MPNLPAPEYDVFDSKKNVTRSEVERIFNKSKEKLKAIFVVEGERGAGKTTALLELFRQYSEKENFQPFFIGLAPYQVPEFSDKKNLHFLALDKNEALKSLAEALESLIKYLNIPILKVKDSKIQREYFSKQLSERKGDKKPVILIDSIYECEPEIRQQIENDILIPLLQLNEVIIILTGRGKRPIWSAPEFRNAEYVLLENFLESQVREQLQKMESKHLGECPKITKWSGGCPLVVRVLGQAQEVNLDALNTAIDILIRGGLRPIYKDKLETLRAPIEKIALLQPFREIEVETYLFEADKDKDKNNRSATKDFVYQLIDSNLLAWDDASSRRGLKLNETVAHPIRQWLFEEQRKYHTYKQEWGSAVSELVKAYPSVKQDEYLQMFAAE